jgi:hypothetical protein
VDQGQVPESLLIEHDDGFVIDLRDDVLLLQKCSMNSLRDSPFFCKMLTKSKSTPSCAQVTQKLLMNCQHMSDHERIDLIGSPIIHVLIDDDRQIDK